MWTLKTPFCSVRIGAGYWVCVWSRRFLINLRGWLRPILFCRRVSVSLARPSSNGVSFPKLCLNFRWVVSCAGARLSLWAKALKRPITRPTPMRAIKRAHVYFLLSFRLLPIWTGPRITAQRGKFCPNLTNRS